MKAPRDWTQIGRACLAGVGFAVTALGLWIAWREEAALPVIAAGLILVAMAIVAGGKGKELTARFKDWELTVRNAGRLEGTGEAVERLSEVVADTSVSPEARAQIDGALQAFLERTVRYSPSPSAAAKTLALNRLQVAALAPVAFHAVRSDGQVELWLASPSGPLGIAPTCHVLSPDRIGYSKRPVTEEEQEAIAREQSFTLSFPRDFGEATLEPGIYEVTWTAFGKGTVAEDSFAIRAADGTLDG